MTFRGALGEGRTLLEQHQIEEASLEAWYLLEFVSGLDRAHYLLRQEEEVPQEMIENYRALLKERSGHVPLQYLTGVQSFCGYEFRINRKVLIPRQDTEILVEECVKRLKNLRNGSRILDLCTGSGCIIVSLALLTGGRMEYAASDLSKDALDTARENAARLGAQVSFFQSDLLEKIPGKFDCIISNPPYIKSREIPELMPEVRDYEPHLALDGHEDGLYFYRRIIKEGKPRLNPGGWLLFEIGCDQGKQVTELLEREGYVNIELKKDLAGLDRVAAGQVI